MHFTIQGHLAFEHDQDHIVGYALDASEIGEGFFDVLDRAEAHFDESTIEQEGGYVYVLSTEAIAAQERIAFKPLDAPYPGIIENEKVLEHAKEVAEDIESSEPYEEKLKSALSLARCLYG